MSGRSDLVDIDVYLHHETYPGEENQGAYLVSVDHKEKVWVPKVACEFTGAQGNRGTLTLRQSLAEEKGLC